MPSKASGGLITRVIVAVVAVVAVAVISYIMLIPFMTHPPHAPTLLDKTVMLTDDSYEQEYNLTLRKGEKLYIEVSGFGQPLDFRITGESRYETFIDRIDISYFEGQWIAPKDGTYFFCVSASAGNVKVRITVSKI